VKLRSGWAMPKVYNKHHKDAPKDAVYVGRPSRWGNPFVIGKDGNREEVIAKYRKFIQEWSGIRNYLIQELKGKDLVCWCAPKPCHADVLLEIANSADEQRTGEDVV
jgi:uncharacterized protein DUF4326